ncbi:hypothetical protein B0A49_07479 [Cryomyces minteri]|uniref:Uncharacterized protein n=1 Tax=Cryomyces minteri TaxID=331657 RepID=A0A4U0WSP2_9PEZI|nr:hypothetical protein B0A49_07479 [Cryomyces minteri]
MVVADAELKEVGTEVAVDWTGASVTVVVDISVVDTSEEEVVMTTDAYSVVVITDTSADEVDAATGEELELERDVDTKVVPAIITYEGESVAFSVSVADAKACTKATSGYANTLVRALAVVARAANEVVDTFHCVGLIINLMDELSEVDDMELAMEVLAAIVGDPVVLVGVAKTDCVANCAGGSVVLGVANTGTTVVVEVPSTDSVVVMEDLEPVAEEADTDEVVLLPPELADIETVLMPSLLTLVRTEVVAALFGELADAATVVVPLLAILAIIEDVTAIVEVVAANEELLDVEEVELELELDEVELELKVEEVEDGELVDDKADVDELLEAEEVDAVFVEAVTVTVETGAGEELGLELAVLCTGANSGELATELEDATNEEETNDDVLETDCSMVGVTTDEFDVASAGVALVVAGDDLVSNVLEDATEGSTVRVTIAVLTGSYTTTVETALLVEELELEDEVLGMELTDEVVGTKLLDEVLDIELLDAELELELLGWASTDLTKELVDERECTVSVAVVDGTVVVLVSTFFGKLVVDATELGDGSAELKLILELLTGLAISGELDEVIELDAEGVTVVNEVATISADKLLEVMGGADEL